MEGNAAFEAIWKRFTEVGFEEKPKADEPAESSPPTCEYALAFTATAQELCQPALEQPTHVALNQCLLLLTKKYWEFYYVVPKRHRYQVGERGHRCIHAVFQHFYEVLKCQELRLQPPMFFLPAPAPIALPAQPELPLIPPPPLFPDVCIDDAE